MLTLNTLRSSGKSRRRVGRGGARGGTSGRGCGGQKSRTGTDFRLTFEGGQMPLIRRLPKRGFSNARYAQAPFEIVNLEQLDAHFEPGSQITLELLIEKRLVRSAKDVRVKVLGNGKLTKKFEIHAHAFSESAREAISKQGGKTHLIEG